MPVSTFELGEAELDRLSDQGRAYYDAHLKARVEPEHNGETAALHLDSGDYAIGSSPPAALRALRARHPDGLVMTMVIGPERQEPAPP
jgi:hypothetical protein